MIFPQARPSGTIKETLRPMGLMQNPCACADTSQPSGIKRLLNLGKRKLPAALTICGNRLTRFVIEQN
jgi:hypothetical protein